MTHARRERRVCRKPEINTFGPINKSVEEKDSVVMTVDEYESIRLIDVEGLDQNECAVHMGVARTTIQGIYKSARKKLGDSLINARLLVIKGGNYKSCKDRGAKSEGKCCEHCNCCAEQKSHN